MTGISILGSSVPAPPLIRSMPPSARPVPQSSEPGVTGLAHHEARHLNFGEDKRRSP